MGRNKKEILENVVVEGFAAEGKCFFRHEGKIVFINGLNIAPGDELDVIITRSKKSHAEASVLRRGTPSSMRVEPFCQHFGVCGGCKWQHIPYAVQLEQKQQQVTDQLLRIGHLPVASFEPIVASAETVFYRNKLEYTFANARWLTKEEIAFEGEIDKNSLGFHVPKRFDKVIPIEKCWLQPDPSNDIRNWLNAYAKERGFSYYDHVAHQGFLRSLLIRTTTTGEVMVMIQFAQPNQTAIDETLTALHAAFPQITSLHFVINQKRNDTVFDLNIVHWAGKPYIEEQLAHLKFRITPKSFYQTNPTQAARLYELTRQLADLQPTDLVYDLYTGTGTIALYLANQVERVIGVEYVEDAIRDARENAQSNGISNATFYAGDMKQVLTDEFVAANGQPTVIVVDPPRAGMDKPVVEMLLKLAPERIVYVSCNAATQARDVALMLEHYDVAVSQAVDMFPHTHHAENILKLVRKK